MPSVNDAVERDAETIRQVLAGRVEAYGEIVDRYQDRLRCALSRYCFDLTEAEDYLQDTFVEAYARLSELDTSMPLYPWLKTVAVNCALQGIRQKKTSTRHAARYLRHVQASRLEDDPGLEDAEHRREALEKCVAELGGRQADIIRARYREGLAVQSLAQRFSTTVGAMKVRLVRLRKALGECIRRRLSAAEGGTA